MKRYLTAAVVLVALLAIASCDMTGVPAPELEVVVRPNPGEEPSNMAPEQTISFGKPTSGVDVDVVFTIKNIGTADLLLEAPGPNYVAIIDQNETEQPFSVLVGAATNSIGPAAEVTVTVRFVGQIPSTRYTARLTIPSNDGEHPDYFLNLQGDGESF